MATTLTSSDGLVAAPGGVHQARLLLRESRRNPRLSDGSVYLEWRHMVLFGAARKTLLGLGAWWCLCLMFVTGVHAAQPPQAVDVGASMGAPLGRHMQVLEDSQGQWQLADVLARSDAFTDSAEAAPNFSFTRSAYWFRLRLENRQSTDTQWWLETQYPLIDHFTFHEVRHGVLTRTSQGGRALPFHDRPVKHRNYIVPVQLAQGEVVDVYIRVQSASSLQAPLTVWTPSAFVARDHEEQLVFGLYYGVLLAMLTYNLMIFLSIRDVSYLHYLHFIAGYIVFQLALNGLAYEYLWPDWPRWGAMALPLMTCLTLAGALNFLRAFFDLPRVMPRVNTFVRHLTRAQFGLALLCLFLPYSPAMMSATAGALFSVVVIFSVGSYGLWRGLKPARYFMLAWGVLLVGAVLYVLKTYGILPTMLLTEYGLQIGSALEAVLLSFALAHRMTTLKEENERIQRDATQQLEARVGERTAQLDEALSKLSAANDALRVMNATDGLTGIRNRQHFDAQLASEIKRSTRGERSMGLLLIDIDHFKQVNDRHGHLAGDACLRKVAATIQACLRRPTDEVARYGGEEFAVVLPSTDLPGATHMAEKIRRAVEDLHFEFDGQHIPVTVSVGCCAVAPVAGCIPTDVLGVADAALYEAKHQGRNRVRVGRSPQVQGTAPAS